MRLLRELDWKDWTRRRLLRELDWKVPSPSGTRGATHGTATTPRALSGRNGKAGMGRTCVKPRPRGKHPAP
eukprot:901465-Prorocentrum_minimum.AAC.1